MNQKKDILASHLSRYLTDLNGINDFSEWFFYTGMLFGGTGKWWGTGGMRPAPHEGLDICYYKNRQGELCTLGVNTRIPAMYDGVVYQISDDDFLGKSIYVRHEIQDSDSKILHSVYAHSIPGSGIKKNTYLCQGEVLGTIADIRARKLFLPGHLHLSMVWLPDGFPPELLTWEILATSTHVRLVDPFDYLVMDYSVESYTIVA